MKTRKTYMLLLTSVFLSILLIFPAYATEETTESTSESGSGKKYDTKVDRKTEGELSGEDFRQVSLLTSQTVSHINNAAEKLIDNQADEARPELEKAQTLLGIIRELLPVTTVTTVVKDSKGSEVYRNVEKIQDGKIPIFKKMVAVEVIQPVLDIKKEQAALAGVRLADADLLYTTVLADIKYLERKVDRAVALLNEPEKALAQLTDAQTNGVKMRVDKEDHPLVTAQSALRLAERQVQEKKYTGAKINLQQANIYLETYRTLVGKAESKEVQELKDDIEKLSGKLEEVGAADEIRGFWHRVTKRFQRESGESQETPEKSEPNESD
jgi:DNA-directed RNA polymerase subunit L